MIDFEIIWKSIYGICSEEEQKELDNWLRENKEHYIHYNKLKEIYINHRVVNVYPDEIERTWNALSINLNKGKVVNTWLIPTLIAASVLLAIILFRPLMYRLDSSILYENLATRSEINDYTGSEKAILITHNNTEYLLTNNSQLEIAEGKTKIKIDDLTIKYDSQKSHFINKPRYNTLIVPRGGGLTLMLSDGSKVRLNSQTVIRFPVEFLGNERNIVFEGEAYFEVKPGKHPFKVHTQDQIVEVLGTSFNVSSYNDESLITTTLVEGKVKTYFKDDSNISALLSPGYQSKFHKEKKIYTVKKVDPSSFVAWTDGRFSFKNESLGNIVKSLSRWYNIQIIIENEKISNLKFTGDIKRYKELEDILKLIKETNEINYYYKNENLIIIR